MKREDIKKPNPEGLEKASRLINELVKKTPSDEFFKKIEETNDDGLENKDKLPKVAKNPFIDNNQIIQ